MGKYFLEFLCSLGTTCCCGGWYYPHYGLSRPAPILAIGSIIHALLTLLMQFFLSPYKGLIVKAVGLTETTTCCAVLNLSFLCHMVYNGCNPNSHRALIVITPRSTYPSFFRGRPLLAISIFSALTYLQHWSIASSSHAFGYGVKGVQPPSIS